MLIYRIKHLRKFCSLKIGAFILTFVDGLNSVRQFRIFIFTFFLCMIASLPANAKDRIMIPVRINILGGCSGATYKFGSDHEGKFRGTPILGGDFNVPIFKSGFLIGITGWGGAPAKSGDLTQESSLIGSLYLGYKPSSFEFILGPGVSRSMVTRRNSDAAPEAMITYDASMACGMAGTRWYFGKVLTAGLGLIGYYCQTGSYEKTFDTTTGTIKSSSKVSESASNSGVLLFLHVGWDDERQLM